MKKMKYVVLLSAFAAETANAEIYMDLRPFDSVAKIQAKYPNAQLTEMNPAWLQANESFKRLSGSGISGYILLKFSTVDKAQEAERDKLIQKIQENPSGDNSKNQSIVDSYTERLNQPLNDRMTLDWVRWVPAAALPLQRFESKYGKAEKCDYRSDSFDPYCEWATRGVSATLNDAKTSVTMVDFTFTASDVWNGTGLAKEPVVPKPKSQNQQSQSSKLKNTM